MKNMQSTTPRKKDEAKVISGLELYRASRGPVPHSSGCGAWRRGPRKRVSKPVKRYGNNTSPTSPHSYGGFPITPLGGRAF